MNEMEKRYLASAQRAVAALSESKRTELRELFRYLPSNQMRNKAWLDSVPKPTYTYRPSAELREKFRAAFDELERIERRRKTFVVERDFDRDNPRSMKVHFEDYAKEN